MRRTSRISAVEPPPRTPKYNKHGPQQRSARRGICFTLLLLIVDCIVALIWIRCGSTPPLTLPPPTPPPPKYTCGYGDNEFRLPLHNEGLPEIAEVFATEDSVYIATLNRGVCEREWRGAQNFTGHTFLCEYPGGNGTVVASDPVPPTRHDPWTDAIALIRCDLPEHLQSLIGEDTTTLTVNLHATINLEKSVSHELSANWKRQSSSSLGVFRNMPVCPRKWPQPRASQVTPSIRRGVSEEVKSSVAVQATQKRFLSMVTQIRMRYETFEASGRYIITIAPRNIIEWIEYHLMIGFEHFYIFDNDPKKHGRPLERIVQPYMKEGLVTYVWYPMQDCYLETDDYNNGNRLTISQAMSSMTSLRRYAHETIMMGHFDVDEFVQLPGHVEDIKDALRNEENTTSSFTLTEEWMHDCDDSISKEGSPLDRIMCVSTDTTPLKSIMKTADVLGFFVHGPWVKTNHELFDWDKDSMVIHGLTIAHVRGRRDRDGHGPIKSLGRQYILPFKSDRVDLLRSVEERMKEIEA